MRYAVSLLLIVLAVAFMGCSHRQANLSRKNMESRVSNNTTPPCIEPNIGNVHEEYHVVVFGYNKPKSSQSHTFATWVRTKNKQILDQVDISWMPKTGVKDEVLGTNKCLAESLHDASGANLAYYVLRTDRTFFEAAQNQRDNLYTYKVLENKRKQKIINPVRACSEVAGGY